jgi:CelD/BcsL family acetyltransferase involved in cellulose biosynthesis
LFVTLGGQSRQIGVNSFKNHAFPMDIAVSYHPGREQRAPARLRSAGELARVDAFGDMAAAEPFWRRLEDTDCLATPYQRFDFLSAWQHHVGARTGVTPWIIVGFDDVGEPLFLWPFGRVKKGSLTIARFLGSKHANFNMGLWQREILPTITAARLRDMFARVADGVDLVALLNQPLSWNGIANPFGPLPHRPSVDMSMRLSLTRTDDSAINDVLTASMRSRLRTKERKLQKLAGYRYLQGTTTDEIDRLLESFFALKSTHMAAQGLGNVFAEPGVAEFLRTACQYRLPNGRPLIEIHALEGGGEVLALFGATMDDHRFSSMFNSYTLGDNSRHSPGLILLMHMVTECARRGLRSFDIGVGRAHYKSYFCKEPEPLVDTFLPLSPRGQLAAPGLRAVFAVKRGIKNNETVWAAIRALRRLRAVAVARSVD